MSSRAERFTAIATRAASASSLRAQWAEAERARERVIDRFDDARIIAGLASAAREWLDPRSERRRQTVEDLARATTLGREMLATGLELVFGAVTDESLRDLVVREAGEAGKRGPRAVFYALAGNVPGQSIPSVVASLLARSIAVIRDSKRQPFLTTAFRDSIARVEPDLAAMIVPVTWSSEQPSRDEREVEDLVVHGAGRIELFGSDATVSALASRYAEAGGKVARHTTRLSVGIVLPAADLDEAAKAFALDVVMYEGRGCLTPHALLVEGAPERADEFVEHLALRLEQLEKKWPRSRGSLAEEIGRRAYIDRAQAATLSDDATAGVRVGSEATWCVRIGSAQPIALGPGLRCVSVVRVRDRKATHAALANATTPLAAVGVADTDGAATAELESALRPLGVTLVCRAGLMQAPPIHWQQDGRRRLGDLLESNA